MTERSDDTRYILATDLDGTFAGGTAEARAHLQGTLAASPRAILLYVTGRPFRSPGRIAAGGLRRARHFRILIAPS